MQVLINDLCIFCKGKETGSFLWIVCLSLLLLPIIGNCQRLEVVGAEMSLNVTQTSVSPNVIALSPYTLATNVTGTRYDDIGYRFAAYARWQIKRSRLFIQPEVGYTSTKGQPYLVFYDAVPISFGPYYFTFGHHIRRWEIAALGGLHTGRHTYVLLGPVLTFNQRENLLEVTPGYPASAAIFNSLFQSVQPVQLLGQLGVGVTFGRFDFNLRLEQSLTPYTRRFTFDGSTYGYRQQIRQGLATAGFLLYKAKPQPAPGRE